MGSDDDNVMAMLCHLLAIFTGFLGPLILWLIKRGDSAVVDRHGRSVLNLQFTLLIVNFGLFIIAGVFAAVGLPGGVTVVPILILFAVGMAALVFLVMGTLKAYKGDDVTYPLTIPFLK